MLHSYFPTTERPNSTPMGPWTADGVAIATPFAAVPGLISGECRSGNGMSWLAITTNADPSDPRTDRIGGDGRSGPSWGLHLIDVNAAMGDLITLAAAQAKAWRAHEIAGLIVAA